jgi:hypothetical protein
LQPGVFPHSAAELRAGAEPAWHSRVPLHSSLIPGRLCQTNYKPYN